MQVGSMENVARIFAIVALVACAAVVGLIHFGVIKKPRAKPQILAGSSASPTPSAAPVFPFANAAAGTFQAGPVGSPTPGVSAHTGTNAGGNE